MRCSPLDSAHEATVARYRAGLGRGVAVVAAAVVLFVIVIVNDFVRWRRGKKALPQV